MRMSTSVGEAPALSFAFYSHQFLLAKSGRALVWGNYAQTIRRGIFKSVPELIEAIQEFIRINNQNPNLLSGQRKSIKSWKKSAVVKPLRNTTLAVSSVA